MGAEKVVLGARAAEACPMRYAKREALCLRLLRILLFCWLFSSTKLPALLEVLLPSFLFSFNAKERHSLRSVQSRYGLKALSRRYRHVNADIITYLACKGLGLQHVPCSALSITASRSYLKCRIEVFFYSNQLAYVLSIAGIPTYLYKGEAK
jgi:hypothetical protein